MTTQGTQRFDGQVCIVTGASRGIGAAITRRLAQEGGRVAVADVSESRLGPAVETMRAEGLDVRGYLLDVSRRDDVQAAFARIESDFGAPPSVLVNNAVWARFAPLADVDEPMIDRTLAVGLKALVWTMQAALPGMQRHGGGAIVNLGSTAALRGMVGATVYAAMKAAVLGLTRAAAVELSPQGVRVNAVLPGMVGTPASKAQYDAATLQRREAAMPMGRFGREQDIAGAVAFLASADAAYVQGAELVVDGAWTLALS